jgi:hypothetical protein
MTGNPSNHKRLVAVPTAVLQIDIPVPQGGDDGAVIESMRQHMAQVPALYRRIAAGETLESLTARSSRPDATETSSTVTHLFDVSPWSRPIRADLTPEGRVVVDSGRHRVLAARAQGVDVIPVVITAPDRESLFQAVRNWDHSEGPSYRQALIAHSRIDRGRSASRAATPIRQRMISEARREA